jgi:hypothetical protein
VTKAVQAGRITVNDDGKIDSERADADWTRNSVVRAKSDGDRKAKTRKPPPKSEATSSGEQKPPAEREQPGQPDYWDARSRREQAEAQRAELEVAQLKGELMLVAAAVSVWAQAMSKAREQLLQLCDRIAPLLAAETDGFKVDQMLRDEITRILQDLAAAPLPKVTS